MTEPASIRYKNPGAMWGSPLAIKWGASPKPVTLNDGKGQSNNIAVFPTYVQGICAQLDLWRSSSNYRNKRFADAIDIWSGGNDVEAYIKFVIDRVPGITRDTIMNDAFWKSEKGIQFLKAQAWHEAGKRYPAPDEDWIEAQKRVLGDEMQTQPAAEPLWLKNARSLLGLKEIVGSRHEAKVLEFFAEAGHPEIHDDETAWCAAFANAMLRRAGYAGTGSLAARSFLTWGEALKAPRPGCIVVYKRGNSAWQGHVNFFTRKDGNKIYGIGGNQSNAVTETPSNEADVLGYRWPLIVGAMPKPAPVAKPPEKPVATPAAKAATAGATVVVGGAGAAAGYAGLSAPEILGIITGASLLVGGLILIIYRITKGYWPWNSTGNQSPVPSRLSPQNSELSLAQASVALSAASSAGSPETLLQQLSAPKKPRKPSARRSQKTRMRPKKSSVSKTKKVSKSSPKRKLKSKG
jgi:uncharacterized protein (TIGR02594 family)